MKIAVVIVTYNRLQYLQKTLPIYEQMKTKPNLLVVVDNCSNDGTLMFLKQWELKCEQVKKHYIFSDENLGGAGGFALGIDYIIKNTDMDYVILSDDDAIPDEELITNFAKEVRDAKYQDAVAFKSLIFSPSHRNEYIKSAIRMKEGLMGIKYDYINNRELNRDKIDVNLLSFVGAIIDTNVIKKAGLLRSDFFIYQDDTEYGLRLSKFGKLYLLKDCIFYHEIGFSSQTLWKEYYGTRNCMYVVKKYFKKRNYNVYKFITKLKKISFIGNLLKKRSKYEIEMYKKAIFDGMNEILGKNPLYLPGVNKNEKV